MFGLDTLSSAVRSLAASVLALSETTAAINAHLRGRLALDAQDPEPQALPGPEPADGNGKAGRKARVT
jgi:hypothetical protein